MPRSSPRPCHPMPPWSCARRWPACCGPSSSITTTSTRGSSPSCSSCATEHRAVRTRLSSRRAARGSKPKRSRSPLKWKPRTCGRPSSGATKRPMSSSTIHRSAPRRRRRRASTCRSLRAPSSRRIRRCSTAHAPRSQRARSSDARASASRSASVPRRRRRAPCLVGLISFAMAELYPTSLRSAPTPTLPRLRRERGVRGVMSGGGAKKGRVLGTRPFYVEEASDYFSVMRPSTLGLTVFFAAM